MTKHVKHSFIGEKEGDALVVWLNQAGTSNACSTSPTADRLLRPGGGRNGESLRIADACETRPRYWNATPTRACVCALFKRPGCAL